MKGETVLTPRQHAPWMFFLLVLVSIVTIVMQTGILDGYKAANQDETIEVIAAEVEVEDEPEDVFQTSTEKAGNNNANANTDSDSDSDTTTTETKKMASSAAAAMSFKRYEKVVIATKIHGKWGWGQLLQSMCLFHFAYNHKVHYDIVVFTTVDDIPTNRKENLQKSIAPATITFVVDNIGLQEEIAALTPAKHDLFLERCNVTDITTLQWNSVCKDPNFRQATPDLAYNWQAEFRSVRIWEHPALAPYKYMLWLDTDGFPTREWEKDPVEYFIEQEGVIMFDHFPQGSARGYAQKLLDTFNATVCDLQLNQTEGHLQGARIDQHEYDLVLEEKHPTLNTSHCDTMHVIHGFMHITDLDFYRQPKVLNGLKTLLGDCFLCRIPDDQMAVTIPAAIYAPEKSWDLRKKGFDLRIFHNFHMDGEVKLKPPGFKKHWSQVSAKGFPTAEKFCRITEPGR